MYAYIHAYTEVPIIWSCFGRRRVAHVLHFRPRFVQRAVLHEFGVRFQDEGRRGGRRPLAHGGMAPTTLRPSQRPGVGRTPQRPGAQEQSELVAFLKDAGLEQYVMHFLRGGFDDMETLMAMEDADMKDLGIPAFHIARLRKRLQEGGRASCEPDPHHPVVT